MPSQKTIAQILGRPFLKNADFELVLKYYNSDKGFSRILLSSVHNRTVLITLKNLTTAIGKEKVDSILQKEFNRLEGVVLKFQRTKIAKRIINYFNLNDLKTSHSLTDFLYLKYSEFSRSYEDVFRMIADLTINCAENTLVLKGKSIEFFYSSDTQRDSLDIDVFVKTNDDLISTLHSLPEKNFEIKDLNARDLRDFIILESNVNVTDKGIINLDFHSGLPQISGTSYLDIDIWEQSDEFSFNGIRFRSTRVENLILNIFGHAIHHGVMRQRDYNDFYMLLTQNKRQIDWEYLVSKAISNNFSHILYHFNKVMIKDYDLNVIPQEFINHLLADSKVLNTFFFKILKNLSIEYLYFFDLPYKVIHAYYFWRRRNRTTIAIIDASGEVGRFFLYFIFGITRLLRPLSLIFSFIVNTENLFRSNKILKYRYDYYKRYSIKEGGGANLDDGKIVYSLGDSINKVKVRQKFFLETKIGRFYMADFLGRIKGIENS
jgi:hypothetical protein